MHPSRGLLGLSLVALLAVAGCGGETGSDPGTGGTSGSGGSGATGGSGGSGATGGGGSGGSGGSGATGGSGGSGATGGGGMGGMGGECSVPTTEPGPYLTTFRFTNPSTQPLYVREDCQLAYGLFACTDGYQTELAHNADCTTDCSDTTQGCIACGMCMLIAHEITQSTPVETQWSGFTYTFGQTSQGCSCHNQLTAQPGKYRIKFPVFLSEADAEQFNVAWEQALDFDLPAPTGVVTIALQPPEL